MAKKTKRANVEARATATAGVRASAGGGNRGNATSDASRRTRGRGEGVDAIEAEPVNPAPSNGHAKQEVHAGDSLRGQAGGEGRIATDLVRAASKSNGRSRAKMPSNEPLNGHGGEGRFDTDKRQAAQNTTAGGASAVANETPSAACRTLQVLQRYRSDAIQSRVRVDNALLAVVARYFGYHSSHDEAARKVAWDAARTLVAAIGSEGSKKPKPMPEGSEAIAKRCRGLVVASLGASAGFQRYIDEHESEMDGLAETLPVAAWCKKVRGFGVLRLAVIVGEAGDLSLYSNPGKLWKRLGLAPVQKDGLTRMPSTWRSKGGLTAEDWIAAGYSPRRRSIMYVIGELIVKLNDGEYRVRYDEAKAKFQAADPERSKGHCHNHGMLCAVKRLVRDLWKEWRKLDNHAPQ